MKIPCYKCITLAVCKTKEEISCPILSYYYIFYLNRYKLGQYNLLITYLKEYKSIEIYCGIKPSDKYTNTYGNELSNLFPSMLIVHIMYNKCFQTEKIRSKKFLDTI